MTPKQEQQRETILRQACQSIGHIERVVTAHGFVSQGDWWRSLATFLSLRFSELISIKKAAKTESVPIIVSRLMEMPESFPCCGDFENCHKQCLVLANTWRDRARALNAEMNVTAGVLNQNEVPSKTTLSQRVAYICGLLDDQLDAIRKLKLQAAGTENALGMVGAPEADTLRHRVFLLGDMLKKADESVKELKAEVEDYRTKLNDAYGEQSATQTDIIHIGNALDRLGVPRCSLPSDPPPRKSELTIIERMAHITSLMAVSDDAVKEATKRMESSSGMYAEATKEIERLNRELADLPKLVEYFDKENQDAGRQGDHDNLSTIETALRELRRCDGLHDPVPIRERIAVGNISREVWREPEVKQWEYRVIREQDMNSLESTLNMSGREGWHLVGESRGMLILQRPARA